MLVHFPPEIASRVPVESLAYFGKGWPWWQNRLLPSLKSQDIFFFLAQMLLWLGFKDTPNNQKVDGIWEFKYSCPLWINSSLA